jgi:dTMP kinase
MPARGKLVVVEGLDKAGKSTQCAKLAENLQKKGHEVLHMRFPDRTTPIGKMIDAYLKGTSEVEDHAIHLLFSANRWEAVPRICAAIEAGVTVVIDRYYYSGVVYSVAKNNPSLDFAWARNPDVGLPRPDICVFLDISEEDAAKRGGGYGEEKYETKQMQARVRENFTLFVDQEKGVLVRIDAGKSLEQVETEVLAAVLAVFPLIDNNRQPLDVVEQWKS